MELLSEQKLDSKSHWRKVRGKIEKDPRYKAVESTPQKEEWFKEHLEQLHKVATADDLFVIRIIINNIYISTALIIIKMF